MHNKIIIHSTLLFLILISTCFADIKTIRIWRCVICKAICCSEEEPPVFPCFENCVNSHLWLLEDYVEIDEEVCISSR
jgi:hypothetical protein